MLNKLAEFVRRYNMVQPGDTVVCAVSGGADSMALLWAMYLLQKKLDIRLCAAHFNHGLRGEEADRDEAFVRDFCQGHGIDYICGSGDVRPGKKGLEAAAREARYAFLNSLPGKVATAHTADDNAETILMHMVRGTGLRGLGGIAPINGKLIRPMLSVTRREVLSFLEEYCVGYVTDSSNETDQFLRNRLRHHVMPLLRQENPRLAENLSAMALDLREDEKALASAAACPNVLSVEKVKALSPSYRSRMLATFLQNCGVKEPEREHIALAESLVFSDNPSAKADFPGGVCISRNYDKLETYLQAQELTPTVLTCPGTTALPGLLVHCIRASAGETNAVVPKGTIVARPRESGDSMRLSGGTKTLKKLFIDRKIPEKDRMRIPVIADEEGVLWVYGIGSNQDRLGPNGVTIRFEQI